jgi:uncharacterized protein YndB with AHSA1/START domain
MVNVSDSPQFVSESEFVVTRVFDAPRNLVFKAWTDIECLKHWWGPKGFTMLSCTGDLRPGGVFHYGMRSPEGVETWVKWVFREINEPERLVFIASFSDAEGGTTRNPSAPDWPLERLATVTFDEIDGKTRLTMKGVPVDATEAERKAFEAGSESFQKGWAGTLDALDEYLAGARA